MPYLGDGMPDAVALLGDRGVGLGEMFVLPDFPEGALLAYGPLLASHFAERIRNTAPGNYFAGHEVNELVDALRGPLGDKGVQPLVHAAVSREFRAAPRTE